MKINLSKLCGYSVGMPENSDKKINYILAGNGAIEMKENEIGVFSAITKKVPGQDVILEGVKMKLPKMPLAILFQIIGFFKDINRMHRAEAMVQIYWDRDKAEYFCHCPRQEVSGMSVDFKRDKDKDKKYLLVADVHSHNEMNAFFSGTDDADEKETRFFGVIGSIDDPLPDVRFRASSGNGRVDVPLESIFELGQEYPKAWLKKVKIKANEPVAGRYGLLEGLSGGNNPGVSSSGACGKVEVTKDIEDLRNQIFEKLSQEDIEFLASEFWGYLENKKGGDDIWR